MTVCCVAVVSMTKHAMLTRHSVGHTLVVDAFCLQCNYNDGQDDRSRRQHLLPLPSASSRSSLNCLIRKRRPSTERNTNSSKQQHIANIRTVRSSDTGSCPACRSSSRPHGEVCSGCSCQVYSCTNLIDKCSSASGQVFGWAVGAPQAAQSRQYPFNGRLLVRSQRTETATAEDNRHHEPGPRRQLSFRARGRTWSYRHHIFSHITILLSSLLLLLVNQSVEWLRLRLWSEDISTNCPIPFRGEEPHRSGSICLLWCWWFTGVRTEEKEQKRGKRRLNRRQRRPSPFSTSELLGALRTSEVVQSRRC